MEREAPKTLWKYRQKPVERTQKTPSDEGTRTAHKTDFRAALLADVYLACDLAAMVTMNAEHRDGVCGNRGSRDSNVCRLLLRSARGLDAVNLEEANESDHAGKAGNQPARGADRAPHPAPLSARADVGRRGAHLGTETHCAR
jgi:hypothetical protein